VDLRVRSDAADPITVRVAKVFWSELSSEEQTQLAPDGPAYELRPQRYGSYSVGDEFEGSVEITSPGLGWLRP
jgi:hypothetical protein